MLEHNTKLQHKTSTRKPNTSKHPHQEGTIINHMNGYISMNTTSLCWCMYVYIYIYIYQYIHIYVYKMQHNIGKVRIHSQIHVNTLRGDEAFSVLGINLGTIMHYGRQKTRGGFIPPPLPSGQRSISCTVLQVVHRSRSHMGAVPICHPSLLLSAGRRLQRPS